MVSVESHAEEMSEIDKHFSHKTHGLDRSVSGLLHKESLFSHVERIQILSGASIAFAQKGANLLNLKSEDQFIYLSPLLMFIDSPAINEATEEITPPSIQQEVTQHSFAELLIDNDALNDDYSALEISEQYDHHIANDDTFLNKFDGVDFSPINTGLNSYIENALIDDNDNNEIESTLENMRHSFSLNNKQDDASFQSIDIHTMANNTLESEKLTAEIPTNSVDINVNHNTETNDNVEPINVVIFIIVDSVIHQTLDALLNQSNTDVFAVS